MQTIMLPDQIAEKINEVLATAHRLQRARHFEDARRACLLVLKIAPGSHKARQRLGLIAAAEGLHDEAAAHFREAMATAPQDTYSVLLLVRTMRMHGDAVAGEAMLDKALRSLPPDPGLLLEKGRYRIDAGAHAEAAPYLTQAVALTPDNAEAHCFLGIVRRKTGDKPGAVAEFQAALTLDPANVMAMNGLGNDLLERERFAEAIKYYRMAVQTMPSFTKPLKNLAYTLSLTDDIEGARAAFEQLLQVQPGNVEARMDFGLFLLSIGDYARGWQEYDSRWGFGEFKEPDWGGGRPRWDGKPLQGRPLLLWGEQGVGDHVLYGTMLPDVIRQAGGPVTVTVEKRLVPLFARSLAGHDVRVVERGAETDAAVQCPFGSMGAFVGQPEQRSGQYLRADVERTKALRARYEKLGQPGDRLVGLAWRSANWLIGSYKSLDLERLLPLLRRPDTVWINLQYGDVRDEIAMFAKAHGIVVHEDETVDPTHDLDGLAAQIMALDDVVSTSNSTVHFAGGLGKQCHVLLPYGRGRFWYWPRHGERTPWYESIHLIRQTEPGDWSAAIALARQSLDTKAVR